MGTPSARAPWPVRLRTAAERLAADVRRSDRFSRMRLGVVAAWAAISVVTLVAACPSSGPANSLGADVQVLGDSFVGGAQVLVRNDSDETWTDVVVTLDGEWRWRQPTIRPRDQVVVSTASFRRGQEPPPSEYRPRRLRVECRQGSHALDVR
jgi:hypothetical protein